MWDFFGNLFGSNKNTRPINETSSRNKKRKSKNSEQIEKAHSKKFKEDPNLQIEDLQNTLQILIYKEKNWNTQHDSIRKLYIQYSSKLNLPVRIFGILSNRTTEILNHAQVIDIVENFLENPNFYPFKVISVNGTAQEKLDWEAPLMETLIGKFEVSIARDIIRATKERCTHNGSSRLPIILPWNYVEERELTVEEMFRIIIDYELISSTQ